MIYKNVEIHNIAGLVDGAEKDSKKWLRVPQNVFEIMEAEQGKGMCMGATGVEMRFVMKSDTVTLRLRTRGKNGIFHVYRGSIQGGFEDHEANKIATNHTEDYVIKKSENIDILKKISKEFNLPFSPEVVRVIFDRGAFELIDVIGDVRLPEKDELPKKLCLHMVHQLHMVLIP